MYREEWPSMTTSLVYGHSKKCCRKEIEPKSKSIAENLVVGPPLWLAPNLECSLMCCDVHGAANNFCR